MRCVKRLLIVMLMAVNLLPDAAWALNVLKSANPCGQIICCCPEMCKMARSAKLKCSMQGAAKHCGLKSAAAESSTLAPDFDMPLLMTATRMEGLEALTARHYPFSHVMSFHSFSRIPLEKPPARDL